MIQSQFSLASFLNTRSKELYNLTVQYGQACLLSDKDKASYYWKAIIEGYSELDKLFEQVHKLEAKFDDHTDILAELEED